MLTRYALSGYQTLVSNAIPAGTFSKGMLFGGQKDFKKVNPPGSLR